MVRYNPQPTVWIERREILDYLVNDGIDVLVVELILLRHGHSLQWDELLEQTWRVHASSAAGYAVKSAGCK